jgi:hypothetical protein
MASKIFPNDYLPITPTASTEVFANGGFTTPSGIIGLFSLTSDTVVNFNSSMTSAAAQALIDAILVDLGGHTLTFQFADGTYSSMVDRLTFSGFMNGTVEIVGNMLEDKSDRHTNQSVILPVGLDISDIRCVTRIYNLSIIAEDSMYYSCVTASGSSTPVYVSGCYFHASSKLNGNIGLFLLGVDASVSFCVFSGTTYGIMSSDGAKIQCYENDDYSTLPDYAITVGSGVIYYEGGMTITGAISDLVVNGGVVIPNHVHVAQTFTLTATDISNKYVELSNTPNPLSLVEVAVAGSFSLVSSNDFTVLLSPPRISWNGLTLDGVLSEGDTMIVRYVF